MRLRLVITALGLLASVAVPTAAVGSPHAAAVAASHTYAAVTVKVGGKTCTLTMVNGIQANGTISRDGVIDDPVLGRDAANQGQVALLDAPLLKEFAHAPGDLRIEREDQRPAGAAIEPMGGKDVPADQVADHRHGHHPLRRPPPVDRQPRGLVDDDQVLVLMQDVQAPLL